MNAITAAQRLTPVYTAPVLAPRQVASPAATPLAIPSTTVSLGQNNQAPPAQTYTANGVMGAGQVRYVWEHGSTDKLSTALMTGVQSSAIGARFQGLGAALLEQLANNGGKGISQSLLTLSGTEQPNAAAVQLQVANLRANPADSVTFNLTTASGATVTLALASNEQGLAVSAQVQGGDLTAEELEGLGALAESFQSSIDGLAQVPPRLQLGNLVKLDPALFTSLHMNASLNVDGKEPQTLELRLDEQSRSVALQGPTGRVQLNFDTSTTLLGSKTQRQAAIDSYLSQFDAAQKRGKGDENLMGLFKDAFSQLNAADDSKPTVTERASLMSASDRALLSGLADFTASISQTSVQSNPMRAEESDRFDYRVSQATTVKGAGGLKRSVQQDQQAQLQAAYHQGLNPLVGLQLGNDRASQNYRYHEITDQSSSQTRLTFDRGALVEASASQQASQQERVRTYVDGELKEDVTTPASTSRSTNLLSQVNDVLRQERMTRQHNGVSILDDALQALRNEWQLNATPTAIT